MINMTSHAAAGRRPAVHLTWRVVAGLAATAGGATIVAGAFLPWVETFAGLIQIPGVRGGNGRILAAAGAVLAIVGLYHALRGRAWSRWLIGAGGFAALGFSGYLLIQLAVTMRALGGNSMVLARGGPGLWVTAAGSLVAFATLFLPSGTGLADRPVTVPGRRRHVVGQRILSRTADLDSAGARRGLQVALGIVWLLDAALQFQPAMFGRAFVTQMLVPAAAGDPGALAGLALRADQLIGHGVAAWNTVFALIQLAIALGLLWRPAVKAALAGSIAWSLAVWWLGEGLGGLFAGTASPVAGAPGAVILYAMIAVLAWPRRHPAGSPPGQAAAGSVAASSVAAGGPLGRGWSKAAWLLLWGSFAYLILQPAVSAPGALRGALTGNAAGEPGWLAAVDHRAAAVIGSHGTLACAVLAVVFALIAAGVLVPATTRAALALAMVVGLAVWVVGENFGAIFAGMATDPNSGPLLVLLAAAYWPLRPAAAGAQDSSSR